MRDPKLERRQASRTVASVLTFLFLVPAVSPSPASVTLRLLDARSGKPLKGTRVTMGTWTGVFDPVRRTPKTVDVEATTDADGRAVFQLPEPVPEHIGFSFSPEDLWGCWGQVFSVEEVLRSGVVANYKPKCGKLKWQASAKPGEIVIFDKKLTKWDKIRREIP